MAELLNFYYEQNEDGVYVPKDGLTPNLASPEVGETEYFERLEEINNTWQVIKDKEEGLEFEIAVVNSDKLGDEVVLFPSTSFSSITHNAGNAIELAANGAANPDAARIYIAHSGSGGSNALRNDEWAHVVRTGRLTYGDKPNNYAAMPYYGAMARAIETYIDKYNGAAPTKISADESGGRAALALMAALDKNTIELAYLNGLSGVSDTKSYASAMLKEDLAGRREQRGKDERVYGEVTPESKKDARERMPKIYDTQRHNRLWAWTYARALPGIPYMIALGNHADLENPSAHAALNDLVAAKLRQEAMVSLQFNVESNIHDISDCLRLGAFAMNATPASMRSRERAVELLVGQGSLDEHTIRPAGRMAAEQYALELGPWRPRTPEPEEDY